MGDRERRAQLADLFGVSAFEVLELNADSALTADVCGLLFEVTFRQSVLEWFGDAAAWILRPRSPNPTAPSSVK